MKKNNVPIIIAIVSIFCASATHKNFQSCSFYTFHAETPNVTCPGGTVTCALKYPEESIYNLPASNQKRRIVNLQLCRYNP